MKHLGMHAACLASVSAALAGGITVDGVLDAEYGDVNGVQNTQTAFGDSTMGLPDFSNGSELDGAWIVIEGGYLHIMLSGNLESNFNKFDLFIDARDGGQNRLRSDNPDVDFDGLNRMGDDGSGNGLTFDEGFEADLWISLTCGSTDDVFTTYANFAELHTTGGGYGGYLGSGGSGSEGAIVSKNGVIIALDNSNTGGVGYGEATGCGEGATSGIEIAIPLFVLNWDGKAGDITGARLCAFINGGSHDFISNQVLGGISGGGNLGEPRDVDLTGVPGSQFVESGGTALPCPDPTGACCLDTSCSDLTASDCDALGGEYHGDGSFCNGDPAPCVPKPCEGDVNGDGTVSVEDILIVISNWGCTQ